jgi:hypothetical protein
LQSYGLYGAFRLTCTPPAECACTAESGAPLSDVDTRDDAQHVSIWRSTLVRVTPPSGGSGLRSCLRSLVLHVHSLRNESKVKLLGLRLHARRAWLAR